MTHPFASWTRQRLEAYIGTTETLTLEFKSCRALLASDKKDRNARMEEAARDVAAMANEQAGVIIYGIEESSDRPFRRAIRLEDGFGPQDGVSREWFLQFIRDRVHPPLPDIDAVEVPLDEQANRCALVVLVPQSVGVARQTDDLCFWRRDAHGLRKMTVQEIEDVGSRSVRPALDLAVSVQEAGIRDSSLIEIKTQFRVANPSTVTASFAVIAVGLVRQSAATFLSQPEWRWIETRDEWKTARLVLASGSSTHWSPVTPGFTLAAQELVVRTPYYRELDHVQRRVLGMVRLDHDGGPSVYLLRLHLDAELAKKLELEPVSGNAIPGSLNDVEALPLFTPSA